MARHMDAAIASIRRSQVTDLLPDTTDGSGDPKSCQNVARVGLEYRKTETRASHIALSET